MVFDHHNFFSVSDYPLDSHHRKASHTDDEAAACDSPWPLMPAAP